MREQIVTEQPISVSRNTPHVWIEHENTILDGDRWNFAAYTEQYENLHVPAITDGIYMSIDSYQHKRYLFNGECTLPFHSRRQFNKYKLFDDYAEAKEYAKEWYTRAKQFFVDELCVVIEKHIGLAKRAGAWKQIQPVLIEKQGEPVGEG